MGVVYRCFDHVTRTEIALKQMLANDAQDETALAQNLDETPTAVKDNHEPPPTLSKNATVVVEPPGGDSAKSSFVGIINTDETSPGAMRLALSHEFETLARLRHPYIISVLDYGFDEHRLPFFTMPLLKAPRPITTGAQDVSLEHKIQCLAEMLQALAYLHHHKIIHRDLKPDNALLTEDGTVKVLDFGLAVIRDHMELLHESDDLITGTIPYMAPELLRGDLPSESSDLYAFGMIAYELLAGEYPFKFNQLWELVTVIFTQTPPIDALELGEPIKQWLEKLLQKDKALRSSDALEVLAELTEATQVKIPLETRTIQESYMQTARFVGREEVLSQLLDGLRLSIAGEGSGWLIIGEEGVGKTRLMSELRIRALVNGVQVLQGHGSQGSLTPYQLLREPVKRLLLSTPIDAAEANVLKTLLPDIETILGQTIPESLQDEVSKYGSQLSSVILKLFQQQVQPTLLLLDDLHWSPESIDIVRNLVATVPQSRLMIVAALRPVDQLEASADLNEMSPIYLERLSDHEVIRLARSILGDVALRADVQEVLRHEAQGNVNFLLEVIRALLDEVQQLRDIARMRLPDEIAAGGIDRVLAQRLAKLSAEDRPLFNLLAAAGLEIDLKLLQHLAQDQNISHEYWLARLANHAIVEREGEGWQIVHERLRRVALEQVPDAAHPALHQQVAAALEHLYPQAVEKTGHIAYHWQRAGNAERERPYLLDAADYALRLNSFQDAVRLYRRALALQTEESANRSDTAHLQIKLGESLLYVGDYQEAREHVQSGLDTLSQSERKERARARALLADIAWRTGQFNEGKTHSQQALKLARTLSETQLVIRCLSRLGMLASETGLYGEAEAYYKQGLDLAEEHQDDVGLTMLNNNYGILAGMQGDFDKAKERFEASLTFSERHNWTYRMASTLINLGSIAGMQDNLQAARHYFERSLLLARSIGDRRVTTEALDNLGFVAQLQQDYLLAQQYLEESLQIARSTGNRVVVPRALVNLALVSEKMGDLYTAQERLKNALREAHAIQVIPIFLKALADLARIELDAEQAVRRATYVLAHEGASQEANDIAGKVITKWTNALDEATVAQYREGATKITVEDILA